VAKERADKTAMTRQIESVFPMIRLLPEVFEDGNTSRQQRTQGLARAEPGAEWSALKAGS
jgi:hypothetical protein